MPTRMIGCSKNLIKNATSTGQSTGSTKVSQLSLQSLFRTHFPQGQVPHPKQGTGPLPQPEQPHRREEHKEPIGPNPVPHPVLNKHWGLADNILWVSSLRAIYSSVIIISILQTLLATGTEQAQKAPSCLHQRLCHL